MGYPDNFSWKQYEATIGSTDECDAPPKVDQVKRWAAKQIGNSMAMWRNSYNANFPGCKWDETAFDVLNLTQTLEEAGFDATKKGY